MLKNWLFKPILVGLLAAFLLLWLMPQLGEKPIFSQHIEHWLTNVKPVDSYRDAVRRAAPAVVNVYTAQVQSPTEPNSGRLGLKSLGSGVIMTSNGYILTNQHVIHDADEILVALQNGQVFTAQLVGSDRITDLAVLKIAALNLPIVPINANFKPEAGDIVLAIGNPLNLGLSITQGIISATGRIGMSVSGRQDFLQTDAAINRGNSGGALVNSRGELIGISTLSLNRAADNISFAIPYQLAAKIMQKLIQDGRVIRGYIGVTGRDLNNVASQLWAASGVNGVLITEVNPQGPAAQAGLKVNDIVVAVNQQVISNRHDILDLIADTTPGTQVIISIIRQQKPIEIEITVQEWPYP